MTAPEKAVRAVEDALIAHSVENREYAICSHQARIAADAAVPSIGAQALRDAAKEFRKEGMIYLTGVAETLLRRADEMDTP